MTNTEKQSARTKLVRSGLLAPAWFVVACFGPGLGLHWSAPGQPADPPQIHRLVASESGGLRLEALVPTNHLYALQTSDDLARWRRVSSLATSDQPDRVLELAPATNARGFYRFAREATMFRFEPRHSGVCDSEGIAGTNVSIKWTFKTGDEVFASPAVIGGVVYIGSADTNFYALDAETGTEKWHFRAGGAIRSSAAVVDGIAHFSSRDGFLYALKAVDGTELWRCKIAETNQTASVDNWDYFDSSPTLVDGAIYVGSGDKQLRAIDAATGQTNWTFLAKGKIRSTPAVADGVVYFGGLDGYLYAVRASDGTNLWKFKAQGNSNFPVGEIYHAPAVVNGVVYFGSKDSCLYALDAATGTKKWRTAVQGGVTWTFNSPAIYSGLALIGTSIPGYLCALDLTTGKQKWQYPTPGLIQVYSSPAVVEGVAYFGSGDALSTCTSPAHPQPKPAYLHAVNIATGKEKWKFRVSGHVYSSPAVVDGSIYFGCLDGCVYALN